jgi:hypothetical protein
MCIKYSLLTTNKTESTYMEYCFCAFTPAVSGCTVLPSLLKNSQSLHLEGHLSLPSQRCRRRYVGPLNPQGWVCKSSQLRWTQYHFPQMVERIIVAIETSAFGYNFGLLFYCKSIGNIIFPENVRYSIIFYKNKNVYWTLGIESLYLLEIFRILIIIEIFRETF